MAAMASSSEDSSPEDEEERKVMEKDLSRVLAHLMVSVERGIRRIQLGQVAQELWKLNAPVVYRNRRTKVATRDSWVQTNPEDDVPDAPQGQPMAPLASEEEFSSDTELRLKHQAQATAEEDASAGSSGSSDDLSSARALSDITSIDELEQDLVRSAIAILPGCRDLCGRSVVYLSLQRLKEHSSISPQQVAELILYFTTIPKRDVVRLGVLLLVDAREASSAESNFLEKCLSSVEACAPRTVSLVLSWQKQSQKPIIPPTSSLHRTHIRFETIVNVNQLLKYIRRSQLLPEYGGSYAYDHEEWINFHKFVDPFANGCRLSGEHLLAVVQELRSHQLPPSSSLSSAMIERHKRQIVEALEDDQLRHLEAEGDNFLAQLQAHQKRAPQNHDYRELLDKCTLLYKQLKKILQRLTKLADKRLSRLQECMMMRSFEEESSQVLSWLCHKGDETLKRHKVLAESFREIREQENEFDKFYFVAMQQIERGNDLLDDAPKPKIVSSAGINGMASVLKSQIAEFSERLEEAREKLEDTKQCYNLLDKSYKWALETMQFVSSMKVDSSTSLDTLTKTIKQLESYFNEHPPLKEEAFAEMLSLAKKLKNDHLLSQCQVAKNKCQETVDLTQARLATLQAAKRQLEEQNIATLEENCRIQSSKPYIWMPVISSSPYKSSSQSFLSRGNSLYGSQQILREATGSYTSFPSSYYPVGGLNRNWKAASKDNILHGGLGTEHSPAVCHRVLDSVHLRSLCRASYPPSGSLEGGLENAGGKEMFSDDTLSITSSVYDTLNLNKLKSEKSWKMCEDALTMATEVVKDQNTQLQQFSERITNEDLDVLEEKTPDKPQKPVPVNMHLLRCASCSDFEELLSNKNAELEAEKKTKKILKLIMREMIQTERDYVKSLEYIIQNYIPLLQKCDIPQPLRGQRNVLFGNIEKIYEFHNCYFLHELEQCENLPFAVGQCFLKFEPQFYLYALYNKNKPKSDDLMLEFGSNFFKEKQKELEDKMDLASYLLKPVQRMGKYALLLKQLLKECPEQHCDYNDLKAAEEMVHFQLRHGNDLLAMDALRECDINVKEQGRLLRQDQFLVWQGKSGKALRHLFLFEDLILFSKARRDPVCKGHDYYQYKNSIKTTDIGLTEQVGDSPTKFEIWFRKRKAHDIYTLQAPSAEVKEAWVQDISKLLWKQAMRNRELRLAEMSSMGIGSKPCLDISPSQDQICDRSISLQQLNKAPRFRNSIAVSSCDNFGNRRPNSIISVSSSSSSGSSIISSTPLGRPPPHLESSEKDSRWLSVAQQSQCSAESGIFTDASVSGESFAENDFQRQKQLECSDSVLSQSSLTTVAADC